METKNIPDKAGKWTKHPTHSGKADAETIAVGADGASWYAQTDGTMFRAPQPGDGVDLGYWLGPFGNAKADVIAIHNQDDVWRIYKGEIWRYDTHKWTKVPTHSGRADAKTISASADGSCWYAQTDGKLFRRENNTWKQDPTANVDVIAVFDKDDWLGRQQQRRSLALFRRPVGEDRGGQRTDLAIHCHSSGYKRSGPDRDDPLSCARCGHDQSHYRQNRGAKPSPQPRSNQCRANAHDAPSQLPRLITSSTNSPDKANDRLILAK